MVAINLRVAALGMLLALIWSVPARAQSDAEKIRQIENEAAGWSRNMDQLMASFTEDVIYEDVPLGLVFQGKEQIRSFAQSFFDAFPDLKAAIVSTVVSGDRAASEWRFTGTQAGTLMGIPATGGKMDMRGTSIYEFDGGKIKRKADYWDSATVLKQLGAVPAKP